MPETNVAKILVVDDEVELKNALVEALSAQSFEVRGFTNGAHALSALREEAFDVLVSDLMMPELDGITLIERALEIDPHLVAIMMTGQGTIQTAVDAMKIGAFDYVLKPFRLATLMPTLTRAINARRLRLENMQLRETVAIYELCQTIALTLDEQTLISKLADAALQQTEADEVSILLPANSGDELYVAAVRGENRQRLIGERVPLDETISGWVVRERESLLLTGEVNDPRFHSLWPHPEIKSAISIPMQVGNKLIGTININAVDRPRPFTLGQMKALTILASTAAAALESAFLYGQLRTAEANYRSIFENAVEGIFRSTPEGRFIAVNPAMATIFGYPDPRAMIEAITDIKTQIYVHPEDRACAEQLENEQGVLRAFELEAYHKGGKSIWLSLNRRVIRDEKGNALYHEGSVEDITDRTRAAEALLESEERYRDLVENAHDIIYSHDLKGNYTSSNRASEEITGYTLEESLRMSLIDTVAPEYVERAREMTARKIAGEDITAYELEIIAKDGRRVPLEVNTRLMLENGVPVGVTGIARDITERKKAEAELRFQKSLLESQTEASIDGVLVVSPTGEILSYNHRFLALWGLAGEEILGKSDREALGSVLHRVKSPQRFVERVQYLYEHPDERSEEEIELSDGRTFERHSAPVHGPLGEHYGRVWFFRDITERKLAQAELT
ncbi:MAG TPA: PAS domain S-box protein, partial [Pyrinomonadaceae bacterium]